MPTSRHMHRKVAADRCPLQAVSAIDSPEFDDFVAELGDDRCWPDDSLSSDGRLTQEQHLLALGFPVAFAAGDELPDTVDQDADVYEAAVVNIEVARLHRHLRLLPEMERRVVMLQWGIGCTPHTEGQLAARTGLAPGSVARVAQRGLRMLRESYGAVGREAA